jgi:hypothetical protein
VLLVNYANKIREKSMKMKEMNNIGFDRRTRCDEREDPHLLLIVK